MLLLRGRPEPVASWARRGLVPVRVIPLDGWTAVLPAGPSRAMPPYDDTLETLAARPVASRLCSAIGLFAVDGKAVITVHPAGWRAIQRWFVWSPGDGLVRPRHLALGRPGDLVAAAGTHDEGARRRVREVLVDGAGDAHSVLCNLLAVLSLPGADFLDGGRDPATSLDSTLVEPGEQHVAKFQKIVNDQARHRAELEG